ncbi:AAA family ATPase, partial [Endothiovibrio diazotrophicus]
MPDGTLGYLLIDEVSYIRDWDKAVKYAADAGMLERVVLVATGSDRVLIQEARMRLPGRRGREEVVDFHLFPLSFREVVTLKRGSGLIAAIDEVATEGNEGPDAEVIDTLFALFDDYLLHGGYLTAINDLAKEGRIGEATLA